MRPLLPVITKTLPAITKTALLIGAALGAGYLWYAQYLSGEALFLALLALVFLRGFSVLSEKIDGLHWRVGKLSKQIDGDDHDIESGKC